jgi:hypothetical protein
MANVETAQSTGNNKTIFAKQATAAESDRNDLTGC